MIKMAAFDFDGTIGDTMELCVDTFRQVLEQHLNRTVCYDEIAATFGRNEQGMLMQLAGERWPQAYAELLDVYRRNLTRCSRPFPGIPELIAGLQRKNVLTALITGKGCDTCSITLEQYGMTGTFCAVETGRTDRADKPSAMKRLMDSYGLHPDEFVYIGDTVYDADSAHEAGCICLSAAYGSAADTAALERVNHGKVFTTVEALQAYFDGALFRT
jgi:Predicted phosphatases